jgi:predicted Zn-dependent protease with MMP-like domain
VVPQPTLVGHDGRVITVSREDFEDLVGQALDQIPDELARLMDNVVVLVEDQPPPGQRLLGLYHGVPLTERGQYYAGMLPDRITIYRMPILRMCSSEAQAVEQVRVTVVHEVAHHFGISDERLDELGYA